MFVSTNFLLLLSHKFGDFEHFCAAFYSSPLNATTHIVILARYLPWSEEDFSFLQMSKRRDYVHFLRGSAAEVRDLHRAKVAYLLLVERVVQSILVGRCKWSICFFGRRFE
jgi:hypothetical protein